MAFQRISFALGLSLLTAAAPSCDRGGDDEGDGGPGGGKADGLGDAGICAGKVLDKTIGDDGNKPFDLSALDDVFARLVLRAKGNADECPESFAEIMAKLRETDTENCAGVRDGIRTAVVSETSQVMGKADSFRAVTLRQCGSRKSHELLFSMFGIAGAPKALPESVEVIAFDAANEAFNYYALEGGELGFFGSSTDYMTGEGGRCKNCHPAGGLNMKELAAPWVHWEGLTTTPGASALVDKFDDLGTKTDGVELEELVNRGNQAIDDVRVRTLLATNDLRQVLRPLFCTVQINLEEAGPGPNTPPPVIPAQPLVGSLAFDGVPATPEQYAAAIKLSGQKILGPNGKTQLKNASGKPATDTHFSLAYVVKSNEDVLYLNKLQELQVIDRDFRLDVLAVDMTRPVFSDARCALLESAPDLGKLTTSTGKAKAGLPKKIREGFLRSLTEAAEGSAGAQLSANLANTNDSADHEAAAQAFMTACKARPVEEFIGDALQVVSLQRERARELAIMEFPSTLPFDELEVPRGTFLDPANCTLVNDK